MPNAEHDGSIFRDRPLVVVVVISTLESGHSLEWYIPTSIYFRIIIITNTKKRRKHIPNTNHHDASETHTPAERIILLYKNNPESFVLYCTVHTTLSLSLTGFVGHRLVCVWSLVFRNRPKRVWVGFFGGGCVPHVLPISRRPAIYRKSKPRSVGTMQEALSPRIRILPQKQRPDDISCVVVVVYIHTYTISWDSHNNQQHWKSTL